jgi:hypothetical protein
MMHVAYTGCISIAPDSVIRQVRCPATDETDNLDWDKFQAKRNIIQTSGQ